MKIIEILFKCIVQLFAYWSHEKNFDHVFFFTRLLDSQSSELIGPIISECLVHCFP